MLRRSDRPPTRTHWSKLGRIRGWTRVPDEQLPDGRWRRMLRCDVRGKVIPSLGVGYHRQRGPGCLKRAAEWDGR